MEFHTFLAAFINIPAQIVKTGRRVRWRILAYNPWLGAFLATCTLHPADPKIPIHLRGIACLTSSLVAPDEPAELVYRMT
jgi:hypothetical protein